MPATLLTHLLHTTHTIAVQTITGIIQAKDKKPKPTPDPTTSPTPSPTPTTNPENTTGNASEAFNNIISFLWHNPWIPGIVIALILANQGWKKLTLKYNMEGRPLPTLGNVISRTLNLIFKEDTTPVLYRPQKLAQKLQTFTWKKYWYLTLILLLITITPISNPLPDTIETVLLAAAITLTLLGAAHLRAIFRRRHRILMQMFEVANSECKYPKGAELNPWGWVNITQWKNLYSPDMTVVVFPAKYRSDLPNTRQAFESSFNATVSDAHTWVYEWEPANNRVIVTPVPFITTSAPYPFPDMNEWDTFPLGIAAGGKEKTVNVTTFPHFLIAGTTGSGKLTTLPTRIPTPTGWTTMGEIKVGDQVFDENGKPCNVTGISDINYNPNLYRVTFSDGSTIDADADHLWWTETRQARTSRWNTVRKPAGRETLLPSSIVEKLRAAAEECKDSDEITVPQLAEFLNVHATSGWLYDIANNIGHVSEIEVYTDFHYAEQIVKQKQKVTVFDAVELWSKLAVYTPKKNPRWKDKLKECERLTLTAREGTIVTSSELREFLNVGKPQDAVVVARKAGVQGRVELRTVERVIPETTVRRKSPYVTRAYPKQELLLAVAEYGEGFLNDQQHKQTTGGVKTTLEILETLYTKSGHANHSIPVATPLELPEVDLPLSPYLLGVWLGDGNSRHGSFVGIDHEIAEYIRKLGYTVQAIIPSDIDKRHSDYRIWKIEGLNPILREQGLLRTVKHDTSQKHIPAVYLRASIAQRRALLAGLLDTDGTVSPQGNVEFSNTNELLAQQVRELALTLGYRAVIRSGIKRSHNGTECLAYTVSWTCEESPFWLSRKTKTHEERNKNHNAQRNNTRFITDVTPIPSEPGRCIMVDSKSRLFLAGDAMIPTHNSVTQRSLLLHALQSPDWRVVLVDPKRVELSAYRSHPHVIEVATELEDATALIEKVEQEMQSRYIRMQQEGVNHFRLLAKPPHALLLMVDELFALLSPENVKSDEGKERDELHARCTVLIGSIARLGRAAGVHMMLATQRPDAKVLPGEVKALALDTPILTVTGWKTMGDLKVGDEVFDEQGLPCKVVKATEVFYDRECYDVVFSDGSVITADAGHLWTTHDVLYRNRLSVFKKRYGLDLSEEGLSSRRKSWVRKVKELPNPRTTRELVDTLMYNGKVNHAIPVTKPIMFAEADLPVDPYVLGAWLGDGSSSGTNITSVDEEILEEIRTCGYYVWANKERRNYLYRISETDTAANRWHPGLKGKLKDLGVVNNKHIPEVYLRASVEQRVALLQGLMDTDGTVGIRQVRRDSLDAPVGQLSLRLGNETLARDALELVLGLGYRATIREYEAKYTMPNGERRSSVAWAVQWTAHDPMFRLPRKLKAQGLSGELAPRGSQQYRYIVDVCPAVSVPVRCIAVDSPNRQFLAGKSLIATHNSNLDVRIAQGRMDTTPSLMVLDDDSATRINGEIKGRAMVRSGGDLTEFQAYFLPNDALSQVLEMSAAIATGMISAQELLDAVQGSKEEEKKGFRLPFAIPVPSWLREGFAAWVEKRKALVEVNEGHNKRFAEQRAERGLRGGKDSGLHESQMDPDINEVAAAAIARGEDAYSSMFADENEGYEFEDGEEGLSVDDFAPVDVGSGGSAGFAPVVFEEEEFEDDEEEEFVNTEEEEEEDPFAVVPEDSSRDTVFVEDDEEEEVFEDVPIRSVRKNTGDSLEGLLAESRDSLGTNEEEYDDEELVEAFNKFTGVGVSVVEEPVVEEPVVDFGSAELDDESFDAVEEAPWMPPRDNYPSDNARDMSFEWEDTPAVQQPPQGNVERQNVLPPPPPPRRPKRPKVTGNDGDGSVPPPIDL